MQGSIKYFIRLILCTGLFCICFKHGYGQDAVLPSSNLGLTTIKDAVSPPPGLYYNSYVQAYNTRANYGPDGNKLIGDLKVDFLLSLHQIVYLSKLRALSGNVHFTALMPVVKISADNTSGTTPSVNPGITGDLTIGSGIQWSDKKLFGHSFWHRAELDLTLPTGSYRSSYDINPSAHLFALAAYHTFTFFLTRQLSLSTRNQINYNFSQLETKVKPGMYYNGNYSIEYNFTGTFHVALGGYYLKQFIQDSMHGDHHYFQDQFKLADTRETVLGLGPAISYLTKGGIFISTKCFFETGASNRANGIRPTLHVALPLK